MTNITKNKGVLSVSYQQKTKITTQAPKDFIKHLDSDKKREEAFVLLDLFTSTTQLAGKMWGESMIGFGKYEYTYASGHSGEAFRVGFSPRKAKHSIYLYLSDDNVQDLIKDLGKYKTSKACIYVNKLADIDLKVLEKMIARSIEVMNEQYPEN